jgi:hypothetical protein
METMVFVVTQKAVEQQLVSRELLSPEDLARCIGDLSCGKNKIAANILSVFEDD